MKISIVINADTRTGFEYDMSKVESTFNGCVSNDFLIDSVINKIKFFEGFEIEVILFVDEHVKVPRETLDKMNELTNILVVRKHTTEEKFNDNNYFRALQLASGDYVAHFDQDFTAFTKDKSYVQGYIDLLEQFTFVSYPSHWTPNAVHDPNYDYKWCSTRFFICKRESLYFPEIRKCLDDYDYLYNTYPASVRNPWMEHVLGLLAKYKANGVYYPPIELDKMCLFSWGLYRKGTLFKLNNMPYEEVQKWVEARGIYYPNDLNA